LKRSATAKMSHKKKKSEAWVSAIIYTLVATIAIVLILETGIPILENLKDKTTFSKTKDLMLSLDQQIQEVASEGEGAKRTVTLEIKDGVMRIGDNEIAWEFETKNKILDPRTSQNIGNLVITSNANVRTTENDDHYILQTDIRNDTFVARINKTGSEAGWAAMNTSRLIDYISYNNDKLNGTFFFAINGNASSSVGTGFTRMEPAGNNSNLGRAKVIAFMNTTMGTYELEYTLESYSDFLTVKIKNFVPV